MPAPESLRILVTDVNHHVRSFLKRELQKEGYIVSSVKNERMLYERLIGTPSLDIMILDPEIFPAFDQALVEGIIHRNSSLQIIIHTYTDTAREIKTGNNIHLVTKEGPSIGILGQVIKHCFDLCPNGIRE